SVGSFAIFATIHRAESLVSGFAAASAKADIDCEQPEVCFVPKTDMKSFDMKSFDDLVGDLMAPDRIDTGIPSNRDAEGEHEGRCRAEWHDGQMQRQQCHTESGKAGNGVRQYGSRCGTADAAMQDEHDTCVDHWEHREYATSCRTNSET